MGGAVRHNPARLPLTFAAISVAGVVSYTILACIDSPTYAIAACAWAIAAMAHGAVAVIRHRKWKVTQRVTSPAAPEHIDHALTGWKRASLVVADGQVSFYAAAYRRTYGTSAVAKCERFEDVSQLASTVAQALGVSLEALGIREHDAPDKDCTCGFYAARDRGQLPTLAGEYGATTVDLEVEISGHYLQFAHGYRAEKQQVVSVRVDRKCRNLMLSDQCSEMAEVLIVTSVPSSVADPRPVHLSPMCEDCAQGYTAMRLRAFTVFNALMPPKLRYTLPEIAAQLGVHDVRWADLPALNPGKEA